MSKEGILFIRGNTDIGGGNPSLHMQKGPLACPRGASFFNLSTVKEQEKNST